MPSTFHIILIAALFCVLTFLVTFSLVRSSIAGIREWAAANAIGFFAFILYAFGRELPPPIAYEVANGVYAAASATILLGYRRFFGRRMPVGLLVAGVGCLMLAIGMFHYVFDSFALRTVVVSMFQVAVCLMIALTVLRSRQSRRSSYPHLFAGGMAIVIAVGHTIRAAVHVADPGQMTSLLQPSPWNMLFLSAGTMTLPVLTLGAVMLVHDRMMATAERAANRDFLTGAWSRRAFFEIAERELGRVGRNGQNLSLIMLDIDNFKQINDSSGHAIGDLVLVDAVLRADAAIRSVDYFARVGGEEFAVLLPDTNRAAASAVANRLRAALETQPGGGDGRVPAYTVSIGVATLVGGEAFAHLMARADSALYQAKAMGRNRVVSSEDSAGQPRHP